MKDKIYEVYKQDERLFITLDYQKAKKFIEELVGDVNGDTPFESPVWNSGHDMVRKSSFISKGILILYSYSSMYDKGYTIKLVETILN